MAIIGFGLGLVVGFAIGDPLRAKSIAVTAYDYVRGLFKKDGA
jgi:hypothetical protein